MRFLVCIVIGLLVGAISATTIASILSQRNAHPRALMRVMQHELAQSREAARAQGCAGIARRLAMLDVLSGAISDALPHASPPDRVFAGYIDGLRRQLDAAGRAGADCPAQAEALTEVANACEACHRDYR